MNNHNRTNTRARLHQKHIDELLSDLDEIRSIPDNYKLNPKKIKDQKHTPLNPKNNIMYDHSYITDDELIAVFGQCDPRTFMNQEYEQNWYSKRGESTSLSLSEKTREAHSEYFQLKVKELIDRAKLTSNEPKTQVKADYYRDVTSDFRDKTGRFLFKKAFQVNIFPPIAFIHERGQKVKIATSYIIAIDNQEQYYNIFFASQLSFPKIFGRQYALSEQIQEFNQRENSNSITGQLLVIMRNMNVKPHPHSYLHCPEYGYYLITKIVHIDELPHIYKIPDNIVSRDELLFYTIPDEFKPFAYGWLGNVTDQEKITLTMDDGRQYTFSERSHTINDPNNVTLLTGVIGPTGST